MICALLLIGVGQVGVPVVAMVVCRRVAVARRAAWATGFAARRLHGRQEGRVPRKPNWRLAK
jgi:hypothetical protein